MAENFSIEHSRTKITEVKKTIEDKKQKLDELKQQKKSLMDAGLALDSSNLDSAVQATLMESINDSLRDVENKAYDVSKDANQNLQSLEQIREKSLIRLSGVRGAGSGCRRNVTITGSNAKGSMLVRNTAGRPEPAGAPAFADVADPDMAKAAQWCTEQGTMDAKGDRFEPEGWTPKFKVIEVWNKAFPKQ